jgi:Flp pilus assembly pilin Flp
VGQKNVNAHLTSGLYRVHYVCTQVLRSVSSLSKELAIVPGGKHMSKLIRRLWSDDAGQDIAEYAVMLAVILVLVVGTVRLIGSSANNVFSQAASSIQ